MTSPVAAPDGTAGVAATARQRGNFRAWRAVECKARRDRLHEQARERRERGDTTGAHFCEAWAHGYDADAVAHRRRAADYYREAYWADLGHVPSGAETGHARPLASGPMQDSAEVPNGAPAVRMAASGRPQLAPMAYRPVPGARVAHCERCGIADACEHIEGRWLCLSRCADEVEGR